MGYWSFDEGSGATARDLSGRGNTGTLFNNPTWTSGQVGGALRFDGVDDFVDMPNHPSLQMTEQITVEGSLFWDGGGTGEWSNVFIKRFHHQPGSEHFGLFLHRTGRRAYYSSVIGGVRVYMSSPTNSVPINTWFHIAITYNGAHQRIFINGAQVAITARTGLMTANTEPFRIGGYIGPGSVGPFNGLIDEVRIHNRALTEAEIRANFNATR